VTDYIHNQPLTEAELAELEALRRGVEKAFKRHLTEQPDQVKRAGQGTKSGRPILHLRSIKT
jgi:uncharacterized protein YnzC (UPF0291/DUF896 family)